jgi:hypothetical protein
MICRPRVSSLHGGVAPPAAPVESKASLAGVPFFPAQRPAWRPFAKVEQRSQNRFASIAALPSQLSSRSSVRSRSQSRLLPTMNESLAIGRSTSSWATW